jgi:nucleotide-binding universal stress UspA family protein
MPAPTVLIPVDGSQLSAAATEYIPALKQLGDMRFRLLHVVNDEFSNLAEVRTHLDALVETVRTKYGVEVDAVTRQGLPHAQILAETANPWVAAMVMSSHGHSGNEPWMLGGVADKVIRGALCPTLVVSPTASAKAKPASFRRVLVPLDGSLLAEESLPIAHGLAGRGSQIRVVAAYLPRAVHALPITGSRYEDHLEESQEAAQSYLDSLMERLGTPAGWQSAAVHGHPADALLREIQDHDIDLVVMTSHGRSGLVRWALGSVTDRMIRGPVPVLVIQPGQGERLTALLSAT